MSDKDELLNVVDRLSFGIPEQLTSAAGHDLVAWDHEDAGPVRAALVPGAWYSAATQADGRRMHYIADLDKWLFVYSRPHLAEDVVTTISQVHGSAEGSVSQIRYETMRRLVTQDEWDEAAAIISAAEAAP